jgi:pectate lyase
MCAGLLLLFLVNSSGCTPVPQLAIAPTVAPEAGPIGVSALPWPPDEPFLSAFPGAEGFGSGTIGGRGGKVIKVTTLNDSGPGSLRAAVNAGYPRTVVFSVAGTIELKSSLVIAHPYITIAGQTAPGAGITLRAVRADVGALLEIATHDVIVRFLTLRSGPPSAGDAISILASDSHDTYNVVVDHNSVSWAVDRNLSTWYDVHDISVQWNLLSEALDCSIHPKGCHSKGVLLGGYASDEQKNRPGAYNISFHHNLMAHNGERNPYIEASGVIDVVNNVAYNPFGTFSHIDMLNQLAPIPVNFRGNYFKPGPDTEVKYSIKAINPGVPGAGIFVQGNIGPKRTSDKKPEIDVVDPDARMYVVAAAYPFAPIETTSALEAYDRVLAGAGANIGLSCDGQFFARRDSIDQRVVNEVKSGTGKIIDDPSEVGGWLIIDPSPPCADTDRDGMADAWENKYAFDPGNASDSSVDTDADGYSNLEEFLNSTNPLRK